MTRTTPPFRADHVGSLLRSAALKEARAKRERGEIDAAALRAIEDDEIVKLIRKQEEVGLQSVTDGEYRRASWQTDFLVALDGVTSYYGERKFRFNGPQPRPILLRLDGRMGGFSGHPMIEHFRFLAQHTTAAPKMTMFCGEGTRLLLPVRSPNELDSGLHDFEAPEAAMPPASEWLRPEESGRSITYESVTGRLRIADRFDEGRVKRDGLVRDSVVENLYSITEGQPLSAQVDCKRRIEISRGDWSVRVETQSTMTSDMEKFHLSNSLDAYEGETLVMTKRWTKSIDRNYV